MLRRDDDDEGPSLDDAHSMKVLCVNLFTWLLLQLTNEGCERPAATADDVDVILPTLFPEEAKAARTKNARDA